MTYDILAVHHTYTECDGAYHQAQVLTDGTRAYVRVHGTEVEVPVLRDGTRLTAACPITLPGTWGPCHGRITADLTEPLWRPATNTDRAILADSPNVERAD